MDPVPMVEAFPGGFTLWNASGWQGPTPNSINYTDWIPQFLEFVDQLGAGCTIQSCPGVSPAVFWDYMYPPYTGALFLTGTHTYNAGTQTSGSGTPVYSGTLELYTDHGDNNP